MQKSLSLLLYLMCRVVFLSAASEPAQNLDFNTIAAPIIKQAKILAQNYAVHKTILHKPIIAIAGCSAVGKSYFTKQLAKALKAEGINVAVFQQDDFNQPDRVSYSTMHSYFDYRRLHEVLQKVRAGEEHVEKPVWDKTGLKSVKEDIVACFHNTDLILFEGTYTLCDDKTYDLLKYSDYRIFIDAPEEKIRQWNWEREQLKGKKARTKEKFDTDIDFDMEDYRTVILPTKKAADVVLTKNGDHCYEKRAKL